MKITDVLNYDLVGGGSEWTRNNLRSEFGRRKNIYLWYART